MAWRRNGRANDNVPPFDNNPNAMLASASYDRTIRIWSLTTGKCVKFIDYQISQINKMSFTGTGRDLVVGSFQRADVFDINSGVTPKATVQVPKNVTAVGFEVSSIEKKDIISNFYYSEKWTMDVHRRRGRNLSALGNKKWQNDCCLCSPSENTCSEHGGEHQPDGTLRLYRMRQVFIWDIRMNRYMQLDVPNDMVFQEWFNKLTCHPSGDLLIGITNKGRIVRWSLERREVEDLSAQNPLKPEKKKTATRVHLQDPNMKYRLIDHGLSVRTSPGGHMLVAAGAEKKIHVFKTDSMEKRTIDTGCRWNWDAIISSGSRLAITSFLVLNNFFRHLFTGGEDCVVKVWNVATGKQVGAMEGHTKPITALTTSSP
ncbi:hypothetical protein CRE_31194 [Caenorhabditis remanei]|uniref:Target of rapamycin complex subunit lst8 n=1 Tax=Caenorhabditis remanei TaxID=31234 RepID=E3MLI5_CAERE|nr:hypothetical protein CRE_31194 [Caenorhabditis remanei]